MTAMSASATAAAGVSAMATPRSASSGARPGVRFQPVTAKPARARLAAIAAPIVPRPRKATRPRSGDGSPVMSAWTRPAAVPAAPVGGVGSRRASAPVRGSAAASSASAAAARRRQPRRAAAAAAGSGVGVSGSPRASGDEERGDRAGNGDQEDQRQQPAITATPRLDRGCSRRVPGRASRSAPASRPA